MIFNFEFYQFLICQQAACLHRGHEDVDQAFSQQAALISRHEFSTPQDLIALMDDSFRPSSEADALRKGKAQAKVKAMAYKLDAVADWKEWTRALGIRLLGLRILVFAQSMDLS